MPKLEIHRTIDIKGLVDTVASKINNFREWRHWSPWLVMEPGCILDYAEDGSSYSWGGKVVGEGSMKFMDEVFEAGETDILELEFELENRKPYKSRAEVRFQLTQVGLYTRVEWTMVGSLPVLLFTRHQQIMQQLEMDYERGLKMLKDLVELGEIPSSLTSNGRVEFSGGEYLTLKNSSTFETLEKSLKSDFEKAREIYDNPKIWTGQHPVIIYDKFDLVARLCVYRVGIPLKFTPDREYYSDKFELAKFADFPAWSINHLGAYRHLTNAWAMGEAYAQRKIFKLNDDEPTIEIYKNDPANVNAERELETEVIFPLS